MVSAPNLQGSERQHYHIADAMPPHSTERLCIALDGATPAELFTRAALALEDSNFLELRLDSLPTPVDAVPALAEFLRHHRDVQIIATCRRTEAGGGFDGSLSDELKVLAAAAHAGAAIVDLAIESAEALTYPQLADLRDTLEQSSTALLVSYHNFSETPSLESIYERLANFEPEYIKIVSTATSLSDNEAILEILRRYSDETKLVAIAMGEQGVISRILGPSRGSAFTFSSASSTSSSTGHGTAPGQITADLMRTRYRFDSIDAETRFYGIAGNPVASSMGPLTHNAAFAEMGINAVYLPLLTHTLSDLLQFAAELPLSGMSITMPLKQKILPALAWADPLVERIGACNTILRKPSGELHGYNTDAIGILRPLQQRTELADKRILVLGAGGAARAAVFALTDAGAEVYLHNRTAATAEELAASAGAIALPRTALATKHFDILINATPGGMKSAELALPIAPHELRADLVFDLVYNPLETPLLKLAKERGIPTIAGVEMFIHQALRQFEIWTNQYTSKPAPESTYRSLVLKALAG